jgi:hypothetical protein
MRLEASDSKVEPGCHEPDGVDEVPLVERFLAEVKTADGCAHVDGHEPLRQLFGESEARLNPTGFLGGSVYWETGMSAELIRR